MSSVPLPRPVVHPDGWYPTLTVLTASPGPPSALQGARMVRVRLVIVLAAAAALATAGWAVAEAVRTAERYDGRVLPGVVVDGVDVSGMTFAEAAAVIDSRAARSLDREVRIDAAGTTHLLTPRSLGATANTDAVVDLLRADRAGIHPWEWLRLRFVGPAPADPARLHVTGVADVAVAAAAAQLAAAVDREPADATMTYDDTAIAFQPHADGRRVDVAGTAAAVTAALADPGPGPVAITAPVGITPATTTLAQIGQVLFLDQSRHRLQLFDGGELLGEWTVATGTAGFPTPTGEFFVELKRENPTWGNPAPDGWGRDLPAVIGPGPDNPLGVRAINWGGAPNIRFHGTNQEWTLGTDASHGCVRMANDDVVELFDLVDVGATIISVA